MASPSPQQSVEDFKGKPRLPTFAAPKRYSLTLRPDLAAFSFSGAAEIDLRVSSPTRFLVLNAADLTFDRSSISFRFTGASLRPSEVVAVEADEILVLGFDSDLPIGEGTVSIDFRGTLNDQMKGFYRSVYEVNGETRNMAVTQFEPTDARRCFPCWDEPAFKATFKIVLEVPSDVIALSNMPVIDEKLDGSVKIVTYQESPIMSTYLVAVVVGLFDFVEAVSSDGTKVRVYCQLGKADQGKFALDVAVKTLPLYQKYFGVPYCLPKLDMVAIPDFAAGAMENYGLVTYRETYLLYDEHQSAAANKQRVASVVAHELAHQWFGNLVTMEWWTHLWLNEGFATWVSYLANDALFPEWKVWTQFMDESSEGLRLDALAQSHPIEVDVNHASEIDEIFDSISYRKGASVIRMLQSYLGADRFQKALASYIKKYSCSNAKTEDLWTVLEEESGEPVKMLMDSWTKQMGYPVVDVKLKGQFLELEQTQFLSSGLSGNGQWIVPVTLCCNSPNARKSFLLKTKTDKIDITEFANMKQGHFWVKVNVDQTGFYRVRYDDELAAGLGYAIEANLLSETDRFGILDDSLALCMAGKQSLSCLLSLMDSYRKELDYTVLSHLITISYKVRWIATDAMPDLADDIKKFFVNLFLLAAERYGWEPKEGETDSDAMLRGELLCVLAAFGHEETQQEAISRFNAFIEDRSSPLLPPDIRKAAYIAVMRKVSISNKTGYESLLRVYREADRSQEKERVLSSLASSPDPDVVLESLNFLLSAEVRSQDAIFGLAGISKEGREIAWKWLKDNWDQIIKTWGSGFLITRFVGTIVSPFSSEEKALEIEEFFSTRTKPSMARTLKQSLERVRINSNWVNSIKNENTLAAVVKELTLKKHS